MTGAHYCRHCGVEIRRVFGNWRHVARLGPVACPRADPEVVTDGPDDGADGRPTRG